MWIYKDNLMTHEQLREAMWVLAPGKDYWIRDGALDWQDESTCPTELEIQAEVDRQAGLTYQRLRAAAYPPVTDYLDGVVKGDQAQIAQYIAACQAVKALYPKP
jgi:hypothetical protein